MVLFNGYTLILIHAILKLFLLRIHAAPCGECACFRLKVDCSGRNLSQIPDHIPRNTTSLLFQKNNLTELQKEQFCWLRNLMKLDLSANSIWKINKDAFKGLFKLQQLYLDNNLLPYNHDTYTDSLFTPLNNLKLLSIKESQPTPSAVYPDNSLRRLSSLETLFIDGLRSTPLGAGFAEMKKLTKIVFNGRKGYCNITNIYSGTFKHLGRLEHVNLTNCNLSFIEPGSFASMENLTTLDLSHNKCLGMEGVTNATERLSSVRLERLYANQVVVDFPLCVIVPNRFACNLQNTSLRELYMSDNKIVAAGNKVIDCLPKTLTYASARDSRFIMAPFVIKLYSLTGLKELDLSGRYSNNMHNIPFARSHIFTNCPKVTYVETDVSDDLDNAYSLPFSFDTTYDTHVHMTYPYPIPPNLTKVKYSNAQIYLHLTELHIGQNVISSIDISDNMITRWNGPIYGFDKLIHLDLSRNKAGYVDQRFFDHLPNLQFLNLSYNYIGMSVSNDTEGRLFRNLSKLQTLDLTENIIRELDSDIFSGLCSLKFLYLGRNNIHNFLVDVYHMVNLRHIDLSFNQLRCVNWSIRNQLDAISKTNSLEIDLSGNPFICACSCLYFLNWLVITDVHLSRLSSYWCVYDNGYSHQFIDREDIRDRYLDLDASCHYLSLAIGVTTAVIASLTLMIVGVLYRYRWKLRYWYFAAKHRYHQSVSYGTFSEFTFDAFVSYADGDRKFVLNELLSRLEQEDDLILNVHQRDFTPGRSIAENIIEAVQKSRRTLCILSRDFLESYWCIYELQMANMESVTTGRDVLLIVMMEDIPTRNIPAEILYHIQTDSYIQYPAEGGTDMFWRNLIHALKK